MIPPKQKSLSLRVGHKEQLRLCSELRYANCESCPKCVIRIAVVPAMFTRLLVRLFAPTNIVRAPLLLSGGAVRRLIRDRC